MTQEKVMINGDTLGGSFIIFYLLFSLVYTTVDGIRFLWGYL